jgi:hypothetical protein
MSCRKNEAGARERLRLGARMRYAETDADLMQRCRGYVDEVTDGLLRCGKVGQYERRRRVEAERSWYRVLAAGWRVCSDEGWQQRPREARGLGPVEAATARATRAVGGEEPADRRRAERERERESAVRRERRWW